MQNRRGGYSQTEYLFQILGLAAAYGITGWLGLQLAFFQENTTLIWPPAGFSMAALILFGPRLWTGVLLGAVLLNQFTGTEPLLALVIAVGSTLEALVGSVVMVRFFDFRPALARVRDVVVLFCVGGLAAATIGASLGVAGVYLYGGVSPGDLTTVFLIWWRGDLGAIVALTPMLLLIREGSPAWPTLLRHREFWLVSATLFLSCAMAFGGTVSPQWAQTAAHLPFACLVWAGVRLGTRGASLVSVTTLAVATTATAYHLGPFAVEDSHASMTLLWSYGMGLGTLALTLAAAVSQRDLAEALRREALAEQQRVERERMLSLERERIMREVHDGLGGQLVSVLSMVQRGQAHDAEVSEALRRTLDDMRIMIDSLESSEIHCHAMLGKLRARLEPMLRRNGLALKWKVDDLPALDRFEPEHSLHCVRIIQESVANVIQHARASHIRIEITALDGDPDGLRIEISDDGVGLNTETSNQGRGTQNIAARALALGAELTVEHGPPGRSIRLEIPGLPAPIESAAL